MVSLLSLIALLAAAVASAPRQTPPVSGVVVEDVAKGSAADRAGIGPGDVIVSWRAEPDDPGTGVTGSPFELARAELERALRGPVTLVGRHEGEPRSWRLATGAWGLTSRPQLDGRLLALHEEARRLVDEVRVGEAAIRWRSAAGEANKTTDGWIGDWFLWRAADSLATSKAWTEAEAAYEEAIEGAERRGSPSDAAHLLREWGATFLRRSDWDRAEECYRRALEWEKRLALASLPLAVTVGRLGEVRLSQGDLPGAEQLYREALALTERVAPESLALAKALRDLGAASERRGDLAAAEEKRQRALVIRERLAPGGLDIADSLMGLGNVRLQRGDLSAAEDLYRKALEIVERLAPESRSVASLLNNLGVVAVWRADWSAAEAFQKRALSIKEKLAPESLTLAGTLGNLGTIAQGQGDLASAEGYFSRALGIREKLAPKSTDMAISLDDLGQVAQERANLVSAEALYHRSLALREELGPGSLEVALSLEYLGEVARRRGDLLAAEAFHEKALSIRGRLNPGSAQEARSLHSLGLIHRQGGRPERAADFFRRAVEALEAQRGRLGGASEARASFAAEHAGFYRDLIEILASLGQGREAFRTLERSRARSLLSMLAERDLVFSIEVSQETARERALTEADYDRTRSEIAQLSPARDGEEIERLLSRLGELRDRREQILSKLRETSPRLASLQYPEPLDLRGVRRVLDPGTILLAYSVGKEKTLLFVVEPEGQGAAREPEPSVFTIPTGEDALRQSVRAFRSVIQRRDDADRRAINAHASELYDLLIRPAERLVARGERIVVSPDGPLHALPFAALERGGQGGVRYLVDWKPVHVISSATVYSELKRDRREKPSWLIPLTAFGDPGYRRWSPLPSTREEVEEIAGLFSGKAKSYLGEQATEERAKAIGKDVRYVHFACHGRLEERFPLESGLVLTEPESLGAGLDNGVLQAWEVFERVRIDADLVTLSACETALGKEMGGEGLVGLTRAFQYAGARSILASLWSVGDASTADLMRRFYGYLKTGKSKDEALRSAQIELMRGPTASHPFHWAAFQLIGDWK